MEATGFESFALLFCVIFIFPLPVSAIRYSTGWTEQHRGNAHSGHNFRAFSRFLGAYFPFAPPLVLKHYYSAFAVCPHRQSPIMIDRMMLLGLLCWLLGATVNFPVL